MVTNPVAVRRDMVRIGQEMENKGLIVAAEGNISSRLGGHAFLVTPSGGNKGQLRSQDLLEVDAAGRSSRGRVTSEWNLHREIYLARPDVGAVCHGHPPWATAFAVTGRDLDGTLLTETAGLLPRVPVAPRVEPGTDAVGYSVQPFLADFNAILLGSHGVVTMGTDLRQACDRLLTVERLAQITLLAEVAAGRSSLSESIFRGLVDGP